MPRFPRIVPLGDHALSIEFGDRIDAALHDRVLACASALETHPVPGQIELVPTYRSLTVYVDPGRTDITALTSRFMRVAAKSRKPPGRRPRTVTIPVFYNASVAPDLERVAKDTQLTVKEVIAWHTRRVYRVYMLGFMPGFPYLGKVADRIAVPRLATPRTLVPAGSVGIAGHQTGIYPRASPGGWRIIGRTPIHIWDIRRRRPFLLEPGDHVRFRDIERDEFLSLSTQQSSRMGTAPISCGAVKSWPSR